MATGIESDELSVTRAALAEVGYGHLAAAVSGRIRWGIPFPTLAGSTSRRSIDGD